MLGERQDKFDPDILRGILTNWVTSSDQAFRQLENPWLLKAFEYSNPQTLLAIKTRNTVKADINKNYELHKDERIKALKVNI